MSERTSRTSRRDGPVLLPTVLLLGLLLTGLLLAGCTGRSPSGATSEPSTSPDAVVVSSFDFPESVLLAEIYAQALEGAGVPVRRSFSLGPRELVLPALQSGFVDVVPEYLGSALQALRPDEPVPARSDQAARRLSMALRPWDLTALRPAPASDANAVVVTAETARRFGLRRVSDLRPVAPRLRIGGPPECPQRRYCLPGLQDRYGLRFAAFSPFPAADRKAALLDGVVDVAVLFTTEGDLLGDDLVVLEDDRGLQPPENVVPVVTDLALARHGNRIERALNDVSARLSTTSLAFVNWRVDVAGKPRTAEANAWLRRHAPELVR